MLDLNCAKYLQCLSGLQNIQTRSLHGGFGSKIYTQNQRFSDIAFYKKNHIIFLLVLHCFKKYITYFLKKIWNPDRMTLLFTAANLAQSLVFVRFLAQHLAFTLKLCRYYNVDRYGGMVPMGGMVCNSLKQNIKQLHLLQ